MKDHNPTKDSKESRRRMIQLQMMQQQMMQLQQQLQLMEQHETELQNAKASVIAMEKEHPGSEIYAPVTSGIFVRGELKDSKQFLVNIGNNIMAERTSQEVQKLIDDQLTELIAVKNELEKQMEIITQHAMQME